MKELFVSEKTLPRAYHSALYQLYKRGTLVDCPDWNTSCLECAMTIHIEEPLAEPRISKFFIGGTHELQQYVMEMVDGILDFEVIAGKWEYTYHDRMVNYGNGCINQIDFVVDELRRNPSSRRAVIMIRNARDIGSEDCACMNHIQYFIRNGKLDCCVLFRSNDACKASFMNMFALIKLQESIANRLGIAVGTYTHRANSFHCYDKDRETLERYIETYIISNEEKCTINYEEDWKELMEDEIPSIMEMVETLKKNNEGK